MHYARYERPERTQTVGTNLHLCSRVTHLETLNSMKTDALITCNTLRRYTIQRGKVREMRCDQGINLVVRRKKKWAQCLLNKSKHWFCEEPPTDPRLWPYRVQAAYHPHPIGNLLNPEAPEPITPSNLLTLEAKAVLPHTDNLSRPDL